VQETSPIVISGKVSTLELQARVTDADTTVEQDNILLVGASYILSGTPDQEKTLVMRDDGGSDKFLLDQYDQLTLGSKNCTGNSDEGICTCGPARFEVDTNDATARDGTFTRAVTIVDGGTSLLLQDCILQFRRQTPVIVEPGTTLQFRLDAVDRQGNLATFPNQPSIVTGDFSAETNRLVCTGDECGCCLLQSQGSPSLCSGKPGLNGPPGSGYEQGICNLF
jgi:hypothetical protein